uniref:Uncharacterized protein n=1 Tax=Octopus bimaculoides TaxID=37653 RepID=A0A0L8I0B0_OCTBM
MQFTNPGQKSLQHVEETSSSASWFLLHFVFAKYSRCNNMLFQIQSRRQGLKVSNLSKNSKFPMVLFRKFRTLI